MSFQGRAYLVCCDARTGSSLLAAALRGTGRAGKPFEYFSNTEIDKPWLRAELRTPEGLPFTGFADWRDHIVKAGSEMGGLFAASVHYWQLPNCVAAFGGGDPLPTLRDFFPNLRLVWLHRRNRVAQAISHHVAIATHNWNSRLSNAPPGLSDRTAPYDFDRIHHQVESAEAVQRGWGETLKGAEAITLKLAYEDLAADLPAAVARVCAHVGVDLGEAPVRRPGLEKQAGEWSREMERLYREERLVRGLGPVGDGAD